MHVHSPSKIRLLIQSRKAGLSIHELMEKFGMPKSTVWHHVHRIKLSDEQRKKIREKQGGSKIRTARQWGKANVLASEMLKSVDIAEIAPIALSLLYWAEGNKRGFVFTNTDPDMIQVFLKILRGSFGVKNTSMKAVIRINNFQSPSECTAYWHRITKIPLKNISTDFNPVQNKGRSIYGVLRITISKGGNLFKIVNSINKELTLRVTSSILETASPLVAQLD